jgi:hypothetical protein
MRTAMPIRCAVLITLISASSTAWCTEMSALKVDKRITRTHSFFVLTCWVTFCARTPILPWVADADRVVSRSELHLIEHAVHPRHHSER